MPPAICAARALAVGGLRGWQSREDVFLNQAKLLEHYTDSYECDCSGLLVYYPTYQSLTDPQLRAYFSWRTRLRGGEVCQAPLSFAFLYLYELINQTGTDGPEDGYRKLLEFQDAYGRINGSILPYLKRWLIDYVVYYDLDPSLLSGTDLVQDSRSITVLEQVQQREDGEVMAALRQLTRWLSRSKFYAECPQDMDRVVPRVLRRMSAHCDKLKKSMMDRYFGTYGRVNTTPFASAVFCDPLRRNNFTYTVDGQCCFSCKNGVWSVRRRIPSRAARGELDGLLKNIDASLRAVSGYGCPIKTRAENKWITRIIQEEIQGLLAEKQALEEGQDGGAKKIEIDFALLSRIREDASQTQEKLIVEEETEPAGQTAAAGAVRAARPCGAGEERPPETRDAQEIPLEPAERRLLLCLLCGGGLDWVAAEGRLLSVLAEAVNEKLYDIFADNVLDDGPQVVEDYIDDLKEMICP